MLSSTFPYPPTRGGTQVRTFNLLKYLSQRHSITLVTQPTQDVTLGEIEELRQYVTELVVFPRPAIASLALSKGEFINKEYLWQRIERGWGKIRRFSMFLQEGTPPNVRSIYSPIAQRWIDEFVKAGKCEVIACEHSVNEIYIRPEWREKVRSLVNIHSSVYATCQEVLATGTSENPWRDRINLPLLRRYEQRYCAKFSRIVVTTEEDRRQLQSLLSSSPNSRINSSSPASIKIIPNGVDLTQFPYRSADPGGHRLIFLGAMDNLPNIDAVRFLCLQVLPQLQQHYPDTTLTIVGGNPVPEVLALNSPPAIEVLGRVPKVVNYLHQATICVIPMRIGFGIKNKTLEAMAAGTPVVASDRGLEGLAATRPNQPPRALRANLIQEYVEAISRLFANEPLREELSRSARSLIETEYTWDVQGKHYETALLP